MEDTHTIQQLHKPIKELCFISYYCPGGEARWINQKCSTLLESSVKCFTECNQMKEGSGAGKPRGLYCDNTTSIQKQTETTDYVNTAVPLCAAENQSIFAEVFMIKPAYHLILNMGNQDGKLQDVQESENKPDDQEEDCSAFDVKHLTSMSSDRKKSETKIKKLKKLGKRRESTEEHSGKNVKKRSISVSEPIMIGGKRNQKKDTVSKSPNSVNYSKSRSLQSVKVSIDLALETKAPESEIQGDNLDFQNDTRTCGLQADDCTFLPDGDSEFNTEDPVTGSDSLSGDRQDTIQFLQQQDDNFLQRKEKTEHLPSKVRNLLSGANLPSTQRTYHSEGSTNENTVYCVLPKVQAADVVVQKDVSAVSRAEEMKNCGPSATNTNECCAEEQNTSSLITGIQNGIVSRCNVDSTSVTAIECDRTCHEKNTDNSKKDYEPFKEIIPNIENSQAYGYVNKNLMNVVESEQIHEKGEWDRVLKSKAYEYGTNLACDQRRVSQAEGLEIKEEMFLKPLETVEEVIMGDHLDRSNKSDSLSLLTAVGNVFNNSCLNYNTQNHGPPLPSPLPSELPSPQLHHRILPLPALNIVDKTVNEDCLKLCAFGYSCATSKEIEVKDKLNEEMILESNFKSINENFQQQDCEEQDAACTVWIKTSKSINEDVAGSSWKPLMRNMYLQDITKLCSALEQQLNLKQHNILGNENGSFAEKTSANCRPKSLGLKLFLMDGEEIYANSQSCKYMEFKVQKSENKPHILNLQAAKA